LLLATIIWAITQSSRAAKPLDEAPVQSGTD